eukprot:Skav234844  [mRNA]  locus=scaffold1355:85322:94541:+ [translate_table: standard]
MSSFRPVGAQVTRVGAPDSAHFLRGWEKHVQLLGAADPGPAARVLKKPAGARATDVLKKPGEGRAVTTCKGGRLNRTEEDLPEETAMKHFIKNFKKRVLTSEEKLELRAWSLSDLRTLAASLPRLQDDGDTVSKLCDPQNMRLVADGAYRLTREKYCLISLGAMSEVRPRWKQGWYGDRDFSAQFHELVLGLVAAESDYSYRRLMRGFCACLWVGWEAGKDRVYYHCGALCWQQWETDGPRGSHVQRPSPGRKTAPFRRRRRRSRRAAAARGSRCRNPSLPACIHAGVVRSGALCWQQWENAGPRGGLCPACNTQVADGRLDLSDDDDAAGVPLLARGARAAATRARVPSRIYAGLVRSGQSVVRWMIMGASSFRLHPVSYHQAVREDLILPSDVSGSINYILIRIKEPKTRYRAAKHHCEKMEQPDLMSVVELGFQHLRKGDALWPFSGSTAFQEVEQLLRRDRSLRVESKETPPGDAWPWPAAGQQLPKTLAADNPAKQNNGMAPNDVTNEPVGEERVHGWLDPVAGEESLWHGTLVLLKAGEGPWYGPSFGPPPEVVGDIKAVVELDDSDDEEVRKAKCVQA